MRQILVIVSSIAIGALGLRIVDFTDGSINAVDIIGAAMLAAGIASLMVGLIATR